VIQQKDAEVRMALEDRPIEETEAEIIKASKFKFKRDMEMYRKLQSLKFTTSPEAQNEIMNIEMSKTSDALLLEYGFDLSHLVKCSKHFKLHENEEIKNMFTALGVRIEENDDGLRVLNIDKLRYHKIIIMCDADVDGSHIVTLILTFFFRYMNRLILNGYIYIAQPPLYQVRKGKQFQYCWTEEQRKAAIEHYSKGGGEGGIKVQRYKGLGEMNAEQLWETTMDPDTRLLEQVTIDDARTADAVFSMLMGDEVPPRRAFIEANAKYAKIDI